MIKLFITLGILSCGLMADDGSVLELAHQKTIETLQDGVEVLPVAMQDVANTAVKDIKEDGLNLRFFGNLSFIENGGLSVDYSKYHAMGNSSELGIATVGIAFLPNTWDVAISYSGVFQDDFNKPSSDYWKIYNEDSKKDYQLYEFYLQPIKTEFGNVGFGYKNTIFGTYMSARAFGDNDFWALHHFPDIENPWSTGVALNRRDLSIHGYYQDYYTNIESQHYYLTYNLPKYDLRFFPHGLGIKYEYKKSNMGFILNMYDYVVNPDATTNSIGFGINKSDADIENGFNIKKLFYTIDKTSNKYYSYLTSQNEITDRTHKTVEVELTYAFKKNKSRFFYITIGGSRETEEETGSQIETKKINIGYSF